MLLNKEIQQGHWIHGPVLEGSGGTPRGYQLVKVGGAAVTMFKGELTI